MTIAQLTDRSLEQAELVERKDRRAHLMRLRYELVLNRVHVRVRKPRNGRWKLTVRAECGGQVTLLCAGAEGAYAYVTGHGRLLGSVTEVRYVAQVVTWMIEGNHR